MTISEAYNTQIENEVKAEIKKLKQQNRYNNQRIQELKLKLTAPERAPTERDKVRVLREALRGLLSVAEKCDGWEFFPSAALEMGEQALAAPGAGGGE